MKTTLLKGYIVCHLKTDKPIGYYPVELKPIIMHGIVHESIEDAESYIPTTKGDNTYTILPVYRRIKTEAK